MGSEPRSGTAEGTQMGRAPQRVPRPPGQAQGRASDLSPVPSPQVSGPPTPPGYPHLRPSLARCQQVGVTPPPRHEDPELAGAVPGSGGAGLGLHPCESFRQ